MKRFDSRPNAWNEFVGRFLRSWPWWALMIVAGVATAVGIVILQRPRVIGPILTGVVEMAIAVGLVLSPHTTLAIVALAYGVRTTIAGVHLGVVANSVRRQRTAES